jgi:SAM-dependent methyltransferase
MSSTTLPLVADDAFDEAAYLAVNPDVAAALARGEFKSGREHYQIFGLREGRPLGTQTRPLLFDRAKAEKLARIAPLLTPGRSCVQTDSSYDFLTDDLRKTWGIDELGPVSSHDYDSDALALFDRHRNGLVLDVGSGQRSVYFTNVVNFELAPFESTDVRGVAEDLPFVDGAFDAVVSIAVLEHVKDPFRAAAEMARVLKPGGDLLCCVPFLQPLHGYPHHYYNMTHEGLRNLFDGPLVVDRLTVPDSTLPIWSLTWMLRSWADGLSGAARQEFLDMKVGDLMGEPVSYLQRTWVRNLELDKNFELASACLLFAHKPLDEQGTTSTLRQLGAADVLAPAGAAG